MRVVLQARNRFYRSTRRISALLGQSLKPVSDAESVVLLVGTSCLVTALCAVDWRLGVGIFGAGCLGVLAWRRR